MSRAIIIAILLLLPLRALLSVEAISDLDAARQRHQATRGRTVPEQAAESASSGGQQQGGPATAESRPSLLGLLFSAPPPEDWQPAGVHAAAEFGWQHWSLSSGSGSGSLPGAGFDGDYEIDPVAVIRLEGSARLEAWSLGLNYETSAEGADRAEDILGHVTRLSPGQGAWWSLFGETGHVEGTASTQTHTGRRLEEAIDTEWLRVGLEWRRWTGLGVGLVYEELEMPAVLSLDDPDGAVIATFDERCAWRTISLTMGVDTARYRLANRKRGWAVDGAAELGLGLGWLDCSEHELREIADQAGYGLKIDDLLMHGAIDLRLGASYTRPVGSAIMQLYAGGRLRASGWTNAGDIFEAGDSYDRLHLVAELGLVSAGVFLRSSLEW